MKTQTIVEDGAFQRYVIVPETVVDEVLLRDAGNRLTASVQHGRIVIERQPPAEEGAPNA